ncbi:LPS O-antigen length regulator [Haliea sp. AH-315-K21]|uniref:LPS O-antigen length regulator n=1 Tax=SAR86 cluster bacterium TaxID=2030880 RepID=A0A2A5CAA4_9GAMM|nr:LPS O-antigen length regulator [Haliea sp. AH-315-K21]MBN4075777.1 LPS O-antigen length regulator [Gammaproteobacteria bacterium AH-315-E17]PCJ40421.1 MAG: LPS O-antigen length regulator [SAR86 cluster bacterium]
METNQVQQGQIMDDEIDLLELWNILWKGKWVIVLITAVFAVGSVAYALWLPDIYRTEVLLSPTDEEGSSGGGLAAGLGQLGGLASLAGVNLGGSSGVSQKDRALAIMQSRFFIKDFFDKYDLVVPFMGVKPGEASGAVVIDPELYDATNQQWVREVSPPRQAAPSDEEVYEAFSELMSVEEDETTGLITIAIEWYDPNQIRNWAGWLIDDLNNYMRGDALLESQDAIEYLTEQLAKTSLVEMRSVFFNLIEEQTQRVMLADVREEYAFEILDPAVIPEIKSAPGRALICILGTLLGGMLAVLFVLLSHYVSKGKEESA